MKNVITTLSDRIIFTLSFIIGLQLPAFINAYRQRLSGHLEEAKSQLMQYQLIADQQYQGSLEKLVTSFKNNSDAAINNVGGVVETTFKAVESYQLQLAQLNHDNYLYQLFYFVKNVNIEKAHATMQSFIPSIPLSAEALITGACFAIMTSSILFLGIPMIVSSLFKRKLAKKQT
ncbi:DUF2937 family protein [Thalassotalea ganghwensis]